MLPGTAFRHESASLGLSFQSRPPYYVLRTPTLTAPEIFDLLAEAQELLEVEFDAPPPPLLSRGPGASLSQTWHVDLDAPQIGAPPGDRAQAFTLSLRSSNFTGHCMEAARLIRRLLQDEPFTTLQVVLEPKDLAASSVQASIDRELVAALLEACHAHATYLDKYHAVHPGPRRGAKRLIVPLPFALRGQFSEEWLDELSDTTTLVWRDGPTAELGTNEFAWSECTSTTSARQ